MYLYTCRTCGAQRIGNTLSTESCPACGSLAFGLIQRTWLPLACRADKTGLSNTSPEDIQAVQDILRRT